MHTGPLSGTCQPLETSRPARRHVPRPARVLFDATKLADGTADGIGRYTHELLWHIGQIVSEYRDECTVDVTFDSRRAVPLAGALDVLTGWPRRAPRIPEQSTPVRPSASADRRPRRRRLWGMACRAGLLGRRLLRRFERPLSDYELLHLPLPNTASLYASAAVPWLVTVHDLSHLVCPEFQSVINRCTLADGLKAALRRRSDLLAVSRATRDELVRRLGVPPERIMVIPEAADTSRFRRVTDPAALERVRQRYRIPDGPCVLAVGTLEPRKNLPALVRACRAVFERRPDLRYHLVLAGRFGWGDDGDLQRAIGADNRIRLIGGVGDRDLPALYSLAAASCCISLYEGFCLPVLEAMACGCPVIHSDRGAIAEVAGAAGLQAAPEDIGAIARQIERVLAEPSLAVRLRRLGQERAGAFHWTETARRTLGAYVACVRQRCASHRVPQAMAPAFQQEGSR
jgi:glycosyltransferase involved in cell wall biosynthesis